MMRIAVASGKGGTGKTTVATGLALYLSRRQSVHVIDCDVEAPNAALLLHPAIFLAGPVMRPVPSIDESRCDHCGKCSDACRFNAIAVTASRVVLFPEICHSCGGCTEVCPRGAITERPRAIGEFADGSVGKIQFTQGSLNAGETATVALIRAVRQMELEADVLLLDAPPGASCPMIAAVEDTDCVVLVTEPTPFGLNDLLIAAEAVRRMNLRAGVVINRDGIGDARVDRFCASAGLPVLGRIADDRAIAEAYSRGEHPFETVPAFRAAMAAIAQSLGAEASA